MTRFYCTYFDRNYLVRALALVASLQKHERQDFHLYAVCMDEISRIVLEKLALPNVSIVPLHEIERHDQPLLAAKQSRTLVEYYWTTTPTIILRLLEKNPHIPQLTYLDADLFFFADSAPIVEELGSNSVLIHEHRFTPSLAHLIANGKYNVGLLTFRNDARGLQVLRWWRERCLEWCYLRVENGKMGDQLYLNDWPTQFEGVSVLEHIGAGVAPWNHEQYRYTLKNDGNILVDDKQLIFYHFQSFQFISPEIVIPAGHTTYPLTQDILKLIFIPYLDALADAIQQVQTILPDFSFGLVQDNILTADHTFLARHWLAEEIKRIGVPQSPICLSEDWDCYCSPQLSQSPSTLPSSTLPSSTLPSSALAASTRPPSTPQTLELWSNGRSVQTENDLILQLQGRPITREVETIFIVGAYQFEERDLVFNLFPNVKKIYLFEPILELFWALTLQTLADPRVEVFPYALSDANGQAQFHVTSNIASSSLLPLGKHLEIFPQVKAHGTITVPCMTIESVIEKHRLLPPDMLFLDVQGAEYKILSTLSPSLRSQIRLIYTEASKEELYVGAKALSDIQTLLNPDYLFLGFAPLVNETPTHGNALFVRTGDQDLLGLTSTRPQPELSFQNNFN